MKCQILPKCILFNLILFLCLSDLVNAQIPDSYQFITADSLPKKLLQEKSVVFVHEAKNTRQWKIHSKEIHKHFVRTGVDVVGYFNILDVFSNAQIENLFFEEISNRNVKYILILDVQGEQKRLYFMHKPDSLGAIFDRQMAKTLTAGSVKDLGDELYQWTYKQDLQRSNYLIVDQMQFFEVAPYMSTKRSEQYNTDVRIDKLAVPKFTHSINNQNVDSLNYRLKQIMDEYYPFEYELVDIKEDEKSIVMEYGTPFVLYHAYSHSESLKKLLAYELNPAETLYINQRRANNELMKWRPEDEVYKFYMKHIYSNHYYLGDVWDADASWEHSLINFIENMKLRVKTD